MNIQVSKADIPIGYTNVIKWPKFNGLKCKGSGSLSDKPSTASWFSNDEPTSLKFLQIDSTKISYSCAMVILWPTKDKASIFKKNS